MTAGLLSAVIFIFSGAFVFIFFDRINKYEYQNFPEQWKKDGCPYGFFWGAKECSFWPGTKARNRLLFKWLIRTPEWAAGDSGAFFFFRRFRMYFFVCTAALISSLFFLL